MSILILSLTAAEPSAAEIKTITATGEYRMGDNDTRTDAKRLALLDAKRLALEQAGTYLESVTEVKNLGIARDELSAYTAGIVEVAKLATKDTIEGAAHVVRAEVTVKIDTDVVSRQIDALRRSESSRLEVINTRKEAERLRQALEEKTREIDALKTKAEVQALSEQRQQILTQTDVNDLLLRAWVALGGSETTVAIESSTPHGIKQAKTLLQQALALAPSSYEAHRRMGTLLRAEGNLDGAIQEFREALRLKPDHAETHNSLGRALQAKGDLDGALVETREALRLRPDYFMFLNNLGNVLATKGDLDGAKEQFEKALL